MKPKVHYTDKFIVNPPHQITIFLIGAGGTGSNMLSCLAIINKSLMAMGHPGIHVTVFDQDIVTEANVARQLFYQSDIGLPKCRVLVERINRAFGYGWNCINQFYDLEIRSKVELSKANITISCVDSVASREKIHLQLLTGIHDDYDMERPIYWMDCGNDVSFGQVFLGTINAVKQPKSKMQTISELKSPMEYFKGRVDSKNDTPSCSLAGALLKQDLFINRIVANYAGHLLWSLIKDARITNQGIYINLQSLQSNPISL